MPELGPQHQLEPCSEAGSTALPQMPCSHALLPAAPYQWHQMTIFLKTQTFQVKTSGEHILYLGLVKQQTERLQVFNLKAFRWGSTHTLPLNSHPNT